MELQDVIILLAFSIQHCLAETKEYCFPNTFNATCGPDHVIVVTSARYGRMTRGRCLTSDYHVGCWADVLQQVDRKCSGRHQCVITIPDTTLHALQPCPKDLLAYLETEYTCQKVETRVTSLTCRYYGDLSVTSPSGYLASVITEEHGFGSARCPWVLSVARGQRINVTLLDFGVALPYEDVASMCHVYAKISEAGQPGSDVTICGRRARHKSVYVSETQRLEVVLMSFKFEEEPIYFLLKFEAVGCTDPWVPRGATMTRSGEKAVVTCNVTSQTWHIVCQGSGWFGKVDNCTAGLPVAVITGLVVGVLLGVAMLALVIACLKQRKPLDAGRLRGGAFIHPGGGLTLHGLAPPEGSPFTTDKVIPRPSDTNGGAEYGYTHICGVAAHYVSTNQQPPPVSSAPDHALVGSRDCAKIGEGEEQGGQYRGAQFCGERAGGREWRQDSGGWVSYQGGERGLQHQGEQRAPQHCCLEQQLGGGGGINCETDERFWHGASV